ncbi:MAG TPA: helix-turn-helix transcriptional regulator [Beijerinckiaceae bacterium]|nr:helix-turn-helix transcriptional regulator [Beijerinckiaceae bacterium]
MLTHQQIWTAVDALAEKFGFSASGLARRAGLDPTTFNKSKRLTPDGRERWPSTESIAKILKATGAGIDDFVSLIRPQGQQAAGMRLPLIDSEKAALPGSFDDTGRPSGPDWSDISLPAAADTQAFALELASGAAPYREGDVLVIVPRDALRRGDRVFIRTAAGRVILGEMRRETAQGIDIIPFGGDAGMVTVTKSEAELVGRIRWASQ